MERVLSKRHKVSRGSMRVKKEVLALFLLLPSVILFAVFKYYPIFSGVFISFFDIDIVNLPGTFVGFKNYLRALSDARFYAAIYHNLKFFGYALILNFWQPIALAILINEMRRARSTFRILFFIPAIVPSIAMTILWKFFWQPDYGLANFMIEKLGFEPRLWLNDMSLVYFCMNFPGMVIFGGMNMVLYLAALQGIPRELYEEAMIEGAGFFARIRYVTIPGIRNIIGTMLLLSITGMFNTMENVLLWTGGGPAGATETVLVYAYKQATNSMDYSYAITLSTIVFVISLIITSCVQGISEKK